MTDYNPSIVNEIDVRNFFTPPLDYDDINKAEILLKIEAVEDYVTATYFNDSTPTAALARIPCLLLIAAKIIQSPELAKKYYTLSEEELGDYRYTLAQPISRGTDVQSSPFVISKTWEKMAIEILEKRSATALDRYGLYKAND